MPHLLPLPFWPCLPLAVPLLLPSSPCPRLPLVILQLLPLRSWSGLPLAVPLVMPRRSCPLLPLDVRDLDRPPGHVSKFNGLSYLVRRSLLNPPRGRANDDRQRDCNGDCDGNCDDDNDDDDV